MHPIERLLVLSGTSCLAAAAVWGWTTGPATDTAVASLAGVGTVLAAAGAALLAVAGRAWEGLVPAAGSRLPEPAWWGPVLAAAAGTLLVASSVDAAARLAFVVLGLALLVAGLAGAVRAWSAWRRRRAREAAGEDPGLDRATVCRARRVVRLTGGDPAARGFVVHTGRGGARLVVVRRDGRFDDVVLPGPSGGLLARRVATLARLPLVDPDSRDLPAGMATGPSEWARMTGSL